MCASCVKGHSVTRRSALAGIGGLAAAVGLSACTSAPTSPQATSSSGPPLSPASKLAVALLGTQAGPPIGPPDRTGISTALVVDGATYVIDCGRASATQYRRSGLAF